MKQVIAALALLTFATSTFAVDVTMTLTAGQVNRALVALGKAKNLRTPDAPAVLDGQGNIVTPAVPGVPRNATAAELKIFIADTLRTLVWQQEQQAAQAAAVAAVPAPSAFDPQ